MAHSMIKRYATIRRGHRRRGFTLVESLMAAGVLLIIVTAVGLAVSAGQQHSFWAQQRISGTLAAEELMCRLQAATYDDLRHRWNGYEERPGQMVDVNGNPLPPGFADIGREVEVIDGLPLNLAPGVSIAGRTVIVRAVDSTGRTLAVVRMFVPEPAVTEEPPEPEIFDLF